MNNIFEEFVEKLVSECLKTAKFEFLPEKEKKETAQKLREYFYQQTIDLLLDQLSDEQFFQIKDLDPKDPKMQEKLEQFAAEIPGFALALEDNLNKQSDQILQTGQIPA